MRIGHGGARLAADGRRRERHVHAGQDSALLIDDGAVDVAAGDLRAGGRHQQAQQQQSRQGEHSLHTEAPLKAQRLEVQVATLRDHRVLSLETRGLNHSIHARTSWSVKAELGRL